MAIFKKLINALIEYEYTCPHLIPADPEPAEAKLEAKPAAIEHTSEKKVLKVDSVIDPNQWKLTLPSTQEIKGAAILRDHTDEFFYCTSEGLVMKSPCDAATTKNTKYPRCELREWTLKDVAWDGEGFHTLKYTAACTHLPKNKPEIVCGQVHDARDDVFEVKFSGKDIVVFHDSTVYGKLCTDYKLGEFIDFTIDIKDAAVVITAVREDGTRKSVDFKMVATKGCYFKVGAYVQSNASKGDGNDYGEIVLKSAKITHTQ